MHRHFLLVLLLLSPLADWSAPLCAQGAGTTGPNGLEPRLAIVGRRVLHTSRLEVTDLPPGPGSGTVVIAISSDTADIDLSPLGFPGARLGIDPNPSAGGFFFLLPPLAPDASGRVRLSFLPPASLAGVTLYAQAAHLDPLNPSVVAAFSDAIPITFGTGAASVIHSTGSAATGQTIARLFTDGLHTGPVLPTLEGITLLPLVLNATPDTLPLRSDMPLEDLGDPQRPRILLPDGGRIYRYARPGGAEGLFLVRDQGESFVFLLEVPGPLSARIAVSPFQPLGAIVSNTPIPGGSAEPLLLFRTDGENLVGEAAPVLEVDLSALPNGFSTKEESLTFIDGALLFTDTVILARVPLAPPFQATPVLLPPSGGQPVIDVDQEFAWSEDGTTAAFSAGQSQTARDIYLVHAAGPAVNLTQAPGEYHDVSYRDLLDGGTLALAPDASRVACTLDVNGSPEIFVLDTAPAGAPAQQTGDAWFENTIDQDIGIWMVAPTKLSFHAGSTGMDQDVYRIALDPVSAAPVQAVNLTGTSGSLTPPFNPGATLTADHMARTPGGGMLYLMSPTPGGAAHLALVTPPGATQESVTLSGLSSWLAAEPGDASLAWLAVGLQGGGSELLGFHADGQVTVALTTPPGVTISDIHRGGAPGDLLVQLQAGATHGAVLFSVSGQTTLVFGLAGASLRAGIVAAPDAAYLAPDTLGNVWRIDASTGAATLLPVPVPPGGSALFY